MQWNTLEDLHDSDHFPIIINYDDNSSPTKSQPTTKWNLKKIDWCKYKKKKISELLQNLPQHDIDPTNLSSAIETLQSSINSAAQEASPRKPKINKDNKNKNISPLGGMKNAERLKKKATRPSTKPKNTLQQKTLSNLKNSAPNSEN